MVKATKQGGLFDQEVQDRELELALIEAIETLDDPERREAAKRYRAAKASIDQAMKDLKLKPGQRLRVGDYVIPCVKREGGDVTIPEWTKIGYGPIKRLESNGA